MFVNRSAVVVIPKQRLADWVNDMDPAGESTSLEEVRDDPSIYLLPDADSPEEQEAYLREAAPEIFYNELFTWYEDPEMFPENLSFGVFIEWFDYTLHSVIQDMCDYELEVEDD